MERPKGMIAAAMAARNILCFPDPRLRLKARPVAGFDASLEALVADMFDTMHAAGGIGLAATQIDVQKRVIVMDLGAEDAGGARVFVNPELKPLSGALPRETEEGCLSVPEVRRPVTRPDKVEVSAFGADGEPFSLVAEGLLSVCIQHEVDHLDGKLFVDYLSVLQRAAIRRKLLKERRARAA